MRHNGGMPADDFRFDDFAVAPLPSPPPEREQAREFLESPPLPENERDKACQTALHLTEQSRLAPRGWMETMLAAYDLGGGEGRALMELAESLLRTPDADTRNALIADKISGRQWLSPSSKGIVRAAALGLSAAGRVAADNNFFPGRMGRPIVRAAFMQAMKMLGGHFVFAQTLQAAARKAGKNRRAVYSFDMLGEAARSEEDAKRYFDSYRRAIQTAGQGGGEELANRHSVSIKLSALFPRLEIRKEQAVGRRLLPRLAELIAEARRLNTPVSIDAEENARLELSLAVARHVLTMPELKEWPGVGVVVQAYNRRAHSALAEIINIAREERRQIPVRLVKGAYWDAEIKIAQQKGLADFPVFTRKAHTDLSFLRLAKTMLESSWIVPQIATHNAATVAAVLRMADIAGREDVELQRLHGMGENLYNALAEERPHRLRIYAPVGSHRDLLPYLARRLLENGANNSFVRRLSDLQTSAEEIVADPLAIAKQHWPRPAAVRSGAELFAGRRNSRGWDLDDKATLHSLQAAAAMPSPPPPPDSAPEDADNAFHFLEENAPKWAATLPSARADILETFADLLEQDAPRFFGLLASEGKKTVDDSVGEVREAADFCRYYAAEARRFPAAAKPRGMVLAVSPWNFPLAIFCGQIAAALAAGNAVLAKPAPQTPAVARAAVELFRRAGLPDFALQIVFGGAEIGAHIAAAGRADMVAFTGSTQTAKKIEIALANSKKPLAPLLAETGGVNAMLVDSSALLERAADDILRSAFQSAGQRCSALRVLYAREEIGESLLSLLRGAADCLQVGAPGNVASDIGPLIDKAAKDKVESYVESARREGRLLWKGSAPPSAENFAPPAIVQLKNPMSLPEEIFGPVLHLCFYSAEEEKDIIRRVNESGGGLTFGLHGRVSHALAARAALSSAGNVYVNRDQIGATVGSQPFGGLGLSGTGPKAGGPMYARAFTCNLPPLHFEKEQRLPGPDGERNDYQVGGRGRVLCIAANESAAESLASAAREAGNVAAVESSPPRDMKSYDAVLADGQADKAALADFRRRLALSQAKIIPFLLTESDRVWLFAEKHICENTAACGGDPALLAAAE